MDAVVRPPHSTFDNCGVLSKDERQRREGCATTTSAVVRPPHSTFDNCGVLSRDERQRREGLVTAPPPGVRASCSRRPLTPGALQRLSRFARRAIETDPREDRRDVNSRRTAP
jgi:hypothetical protein